jgi:uncharacterized membrane protein
MAVLEPRTIMSTIVEWLFKYRPLLYERGTLAFRPLWPSWVSILLIAGALGGAYWLYRRSERVLPPSWRYGLSCLRAAAFLILILILLHPVLVLHSVIPQQNFMAVSYDTSKSMEIRDGAQGRSRLEIERQLLQPANPLLKDLAAKFKLRFFHFTGSAERTAAYEEMQRHGNITDLEKSLNQVAGDLASAPLAGIVMITDGADNRSANLDALAARFRSRNIPIYSVGIGSAEQRRDTEILQVTAPRSVLKDTMVEAEVSVRSSGYAGRKDKLSVSDQDRPLQSQDITLGSDGEVKTYRIRFSSQLAGAHVFKFRVDPFSDERIPENNDQTVLIRVEDSQPQILYVEGEPRWDYSFLRRAILSDKNLHLITLLRQADKKFLRQGVESASTLEKGFPTEKAELFKYKSIIIGSLEASFFTFDQLRMISDFVSQRGGGLLMLGGKNSFGQGGYINTPLEDVLPLNLSPSANAIPGFQDLEYKVRLTSYGFQHPICRLSLSEDQNRKRWEAAPALVGFNPTFGLKPGATALALGSAPDARGQNPVLLAFQRFGGGKSVAFTASNSWRWRMGQEHSDNFYDVFWKQMLRWLVSDVPDPVALATEKHSYSLEDSVVFHAEANDSAFLPLNNVQFTTQVKAPSGQTSSALLTWDVEKDGAYSGSYKPLEEGIYEVTSEAFQGDKSLGTAKTSFRVADSTEEFHNAAMNAGLLKRLSSQTGGSYYSPDNLRSLVEDISYTDKGASRLEEKDLWDMPFLFLLLAALISAEWIFRKRRGLV